MLDDDIGKYKKRTKSNTSKSNSKAKHKHSYKEVLLVNNNIPHWSTVCTICGKIGDIHLFETEKIYMANSYVYRQLSADEVLEKYKELKQISITDIWQKYVPISEVK